MNIASTKKFLITILTVIYFAAHVVFVHAAETNMWAERRRAGSTQVAALPAPIVNPQAIFNQLPTVHSALPNLSQSKKSPTVHYPPALQSVVDAIPLTHAIVQEVYEAKKVRDVRNDFKSGELNEISDVSDSSRDRTVVLLQDVHLNSEAQSNLAVVLQNLINEKKVSAVGVEGAFDNLDFSQLRAFENKKIVKETMAKFLERDLMAAPTYVGITSAVEPPAFIGVDDRKHYDANVQSYLTSRDQKIKALAEIEKEERKLAEQKRHIFSAELKKFDAERSAYMQGVSGIGTYVTALAARVGSSNFVIEQFLEAYQMEQSLDFKRVDLERRTILEELTQRLSKQEVSALLSRSLSYRMGRMGFGEYYQGLKELCESKGIDLKKTSNFDGYVRYVLLSDGIKAESLFDAIANLESDVVTKLAKTQGEKKLLAASEQLILSRKLVDFSLTAKEWENYKSGLSTINQEPWIKNLSTFERFYKEADIRSRKMVSNLLNRSVGSLSAVALVIGGFHSAEITKLLRDQNLSYVIASPKLTKVERNGATSYLSAFAREKTPLDKLLAGEKLFLNLKTVNTSDAKLRLQAIAALLLAGAGLIAGCDQISDGLFQIKLFSEQAFFASKTLLAGYSQVDQTVDGVISVKNSSIFVMAISAVAGFAVSGVLNFSQTRRLRSTFGRWFVPKNFEKYKSFPETERKESTPNPERKAQVLWDMFLPRLMQGAFGSLEDKNKYSSISALNSVTALFIVTMIAFLAPWGLDTSDWHPAFVNAGANFLVALPLFFLGLAVVVWTFTFRNLYPLKNFRAPPIQLWGVEAEPHPHATFVQYNYLQDQIFVNPVLYTLLTHQNYFYRFLAHWLLNTFFVPFHELTHARLGHQGHWNEEVIAFVMQIIPLAMLVTALMVSPFVWPIWSALVLLTGVPAAVTAWKNPYELEVVQDEIPLFVKVASEMPAVFTILESPDHRRSVISAALAKSAQQAINPNHEVAEYKDETLNPEFNFENVDPTFLAWINLSANREDRHLLHQILSASESRLTILLKDFPGRVMIGYVDRHIPDEGRTVYLRLQRPFGKVKVLRIKGVRPRIAVDGSVEEYSHGQGYVRRPIDVDANGEFYFYPPKPQPRGSIPAEDETLERRGLQKLRNVSDRFIADGVLEGKKFKGADIKYVIAGMEAEDWRFYFTADNGKDGQKYLVLQLLQVSTAKSIVYDPIESEQILYSIAQKIRELNDQGVFHRWIQISNVGGIPVVGEAPDIRLRDFEGLRIKSENLPKENIRQEASLRFLDLYRIVSEIAARGNATSNGHTFDDNPIWLSNTDAMARAFFRGYFHDSEEPFLQDLPVPSRNPELFTALRPLTRQKDPVNKISLRTGAVAKVLNELNFISQPHRRQPIDISNSLKALGYSILSSLVFGFILTFAPLTHDQIYWLLVWVIMIPVFFLGLFLLPLFYAIANKGWSGKISAPPILLWGKTARPTSTVDLIEYNEETNEFDVNAALFKGLTHQWFIVRCLTHMLLNTFLVPLHELTHAKGISSEPISFGGQGLVVTVLFAIYLFIPTLAFGPYLLTLFLTIVVIPAVRSSFHVQLASEARSLSKSAVSGLSMMDEAGELPLLSEIETQAVVETFFSGTSLRGLADRMNKGNYVSRQEMAFDLIDLGFGPNPEMSDADAEFHQRVFESLETILFLSNYDAGALSLLRDEFGDSAHRFGIRVIMVRGDLLGKAHSAWYPSTEEGGPATIAISEKYFDGIQKAREILLKTDASVFSTSDLLRDRFTDRENGSNKDDNDLAEQFANFLLGKSIWVHELRHRRLAKKDHEWANATEHLQAVHQEERRVMDFERYFDRLANQIFGNQTDLPRLNEAIRRVRLEKEAGGSPGPVILSSFGNSTIESIFHYLRRSDVAPDVYDAIQERNRGRLYRDTKPADLDAAFENFLRTHYPRPQKAGALAQQEETDAIFSRPGFRRVSLFDADRMAPLRRQLFGRHVDQWLGLNNQGKGNQRDIERAAERIQSDASFWANLKSSNHFVVHLIRFCIDRNIELGTGKLRGLLMAIRNRASAEQRSLIPRDVRSLSQAVDESTEGMALALELTNEKPNESDFMAFVDHTLDKGLLVDVKEKKLPVEYSEWLGLYEKWFSNPSSLPPVLTFSSIDNAQNEKYFLRQLGLKENGAPISSIQPTLDQGAFFLNAFDAGGKLIHQYLVGLQLTNGKIKRLLTADQNPYISLLLGNPDNLNPAAKIILLILGYGPVDWLTVSTTLKIHSKGAQDSNANRVVWLYTDLAGKQIRQTIPPLYRGTDIKPVITIEELRQETNSFRWLSPDGQEEVSVSLVNVFDGKMSVDAIYSKPHGDWETSAGRKNQISLLQKYLAGESNYVPSLGLVKTADSLRSRNLPRITFLSQQFTVPADCAETGVIAVAEEINGERVVQFWRPNSDRTVDLPVHVLHRKGFVKPKKTFRRTLHIWILVVFLSSLLAPFGFGAIGSQTNPTVQLGALNFPAEVQQFGKLTTNYPSLLAAVKDWESKKSAGLLDDKNAPQLIWLAQLPERWLSLSVWSHQGNLIFWNTEHRGNKLSLDVDDFLGGLMKLNPAASSYVYEDDGSDFTAQFAKPVETNITLNAAAKELSVTRDVIPTFLSKPVIDAFVKKYPHRKNMAISASFHFLFEVMLLRLNPDPNDKVDLHLAGQTFQGAVNAYCRTQMMSPYVLLAIIKHEVEGHWNDSPELRQEIIATLNDLNNENRSQAWATVANAPHKGIIFAETAVNNSPIAVPNLFNEDLAQKLILVSKIVKLNMKDGLVDTSDLSLALAINIPFDADQFQQEWKRDSFEIKLPVPDEQNAKFALVKITFVDANYDIVYQLTSIKRDLLLWEAVVTSGSVPEKAQIWMPLREDEFSLVFHNPFFHAPNCKSVVVEAYSTDTNARPILVKGTIHGVNNEDKQRPAATASIPVTKLAAHVVKRIDRLERTFSIDLSALRRVSEQFPDLGAEIVPRIGRVLERLERVMPVSYPRRDWRERWKITANKVVSKMNRPLAIRAAGGRVGISWSPSKEGDLFQIPVSLGENEVWYKGDNASFEDYLFLSALDFNRLNKADRKEYLRIVAREDLASDAQDHFARHAMLLRGKDSFEYRGTKPNQKALDFINHLVARSKMPVRKISSELTPGHWLFFIGGILTIVAATLMRSPNEKVARKFAGVAPWAFALLLQPGNLSQETKPTIANQVADHFVSPVLIPAIFVLVAFSAGYFLVAAFRDRSETKKNNDDDDDGDDEDDDDDDGDESVFVSPRSKLAPIRIDSTRDSKGNALAQHLVELVKASPEDRSVIAALVFDLMGSEKVFEPTELTNERILQWARVGKVLHNELSELVRNGNLNSEEARLRLADLSVVLRNVLTDDEFSGFIGELQNLPTETRLGQMGGSACWVEKAEQMIPAIEMILSKENQGLLNNSDRLVFGTSMNPERALKNLKSKIGAAQINRLRDQKRLIVLQGDERTEVLDFVNEAKRALQLGDAAINLLIMKGVALPANFLPKAHNKEAWHQLRQQAIVYFLTQSLLAIEIEESALIGLQTLRTRLIQA